MSRKERKRLKEYNQRLEEYYKFVDEFNNLKKVNLKQKRVYHKDYKASIDYYTKTLIVWYDTKRNRYI